MESVQPVQGHKQTGRQDPVVRTDTLRRIELPEGVEIHVRVAGPLVRSLAWLIDIGIIAIVLTILSMILGFMGVVIGDNGVTGVYLICLFIVLTFYDFVFEVRRGSTPGKKAMGLRVVQPSGAPVTWGRSFIRNLLRIADFLPFGYFIGFTACLSNRNFQRLGDLLAGTVVAYREDLPVRARQAKLKERDTYPPPVALTKEEQLAVVEFADRGYLWTQERRQELANHAQGLTETRGPQSCERLLDMAAWLMEGR